MIEMKRKLIYKITLLFAIYMLSTSMISNGEYKDFLDGPYFVRELVYDNIWGTIYHAVERQCDDTPTITGDGSKINPYKASEHRWIAISQEMLDSEYRQRLLNKPESDLYKGRIQYGDTIWIESPYPEINGWWIVHDTKNQRYRNSIDFLQTEGDGTLYRNDSLWCGKFENIKIYKQIDVNGFKYST